MDGPTINADGSEKGYGTLRVVGLCLCVLAATLGAISLAAGLHRMSLTQTCGSAAVAGVIANSLWPYRWLKVGVGALLIVAVGAFLAKL